MQFKKYCSIENATNREILKFKNSSLYNPSDLWVVTEKVHGSNLALFVDSNMEITVAKRNSFLTENESFYNFQKILDRYKESAIGILTDILLQTSGVTHISIHGEICGGYYPDMPHINNVKKVQNGVAYSNDIEFIVFDIQLHGDNTPSRFLAHSDVMRLCQYYEIPCVPILFESTLDYCLEYSRKHLNDISDIWSIFDMPNSVPNNIREGHVIKPAYEGIYNRDERIIFKDKGDLFKENCGKKFDTPVKHDYSDNVIEALSCVDEFVCANRFNSVVSKFGEYSIKDFSGIMEMFVADVIEELEKTYDNYNEFNINELIVLKKLITKKVSSFMGRNKKDLF